MALAPDALSQLPLTVTADLRRFAPEVVLIGTIAAILLARQFAALRHAHLGALALGGTMAAALALAGPNLGLWQPVPAGPAFAGLLSYDAFGQFLRTLLIGFAVLSVILSRITGIPDAEDSADYYTLLLGGTLGMCMMVSANHLLMVFVGMEMASLPSYALSGFMKGQRRGSEAALKYVLFGAAASGVMLYGISLVAGSMGTGSLPAIAAGIAEGARAGSVPLPLVVGGLFILVGFGFKLGAVPFHFWLPDVFEGAAAEVGAFLAVASKAAAVGVTARVLLTVQSAVEPVDPTLLPRTIGVGMMIVAGLTATLGNLTALAQPNLKRMLAYSTIAHAGYMMMALATFSREGVAAVLFYLVAYLLMNLGAFATVAVIRNCTRSESLSACTGLFRRSPVLSLAFFVFLLSLLGLPPLVGFAGKFQIFAEVFEAGQHASRLGQPTLGIGYYVLLGVGVVNTVISAAYYLGVIKRAGLDEPADLDEKGIASPLGETGEARIYLGLLAVAVLVTGLAWGRLADAASRTVTTLAGG